MADTQQANTARPAAPFNPHAWDGGVMISVHHARLLAGAWAHMCQSDVDIAAANPRWFDLVGQLLGAAATAAGEPTPTLVPLVEFDDWLSFEAHADQAIALALTGTATVHQIRPDGGEC